MGNKHSTRKRSQSERGSSTARGVRRADTTYGNEVQRMHPSRRSSLPDVYIETLPAKKGGARKQHEIQHQRTDVKIGQIKRNSDVSGILNRIALQLPKIRACVLALHERVDSIKREHPVTKLPASVFLETVFEHQFPEEYVLELAQHAKRQDLLRAVKSKSLYSLQHCLALCAVALQEHPEMVEMTWDEDVEEQRAAAVVAAEKAAVAATDAKKQEKSSISGGGGDVHVVKDTSLWDNNAQHVSGGPVRLTPLPACVTAAACGGAVVDSKACAASVSVTQQAPKEEQRERKKLENRPSTNNLFASSKQKQQQQQQPQRVLVRVDSMDDAICVGFRALIKLFRQLDFHRVGSVEMNDLTLAGLRNPKGVDFIKHVFKANGKRHHKRIEFAHFWCGMVRYITKQAEVLEDVEIGPESIELKVTSSFHRMPSELQSKGIDAAQKRKKSAISNTEESRAQRKLRIKALNEARRSKKKHVFRAMEEKHRARVLLQSKRRHSTNTPGHSHLLRDSISQMIEASSDHQRHFHNSSVASSSAVSPMSSARNSLSVAKLTHSRPGSASRAQLLEMLNKANSTPAASPITPTKQLPVPLKEFN